jgi:N-sulfoglucosamine sulfohydrolase
LQPYRPHPGEMLFDLEADPFELNNLASSPQHQGALNKLRAALDDHLHQTRDLGLFPPSARQGGNLYAWTRDTNYPLNDLLDAAKLAATPTPQSALTLSRYLQSDKPEIRFWGASGLATLAVQTQVQTPSADLLNAVNDTDPYVAAEAAHALCYMGKSDIGAAALVETFVNGSKGAFSALETLALTPVGKEALRTHRAQLQQLAGLNADSPATEDEDAKGDGEGNEEGGNEWQARAILVNLGELPVKQLYSEAQQEKGRELNTQRKLLVPRPKPRAGGGQAATGDGGTKRQKRTKKQQAF